MASATCLPSASSTSPSTTRAPSRANRRPSAAPMPRAPPLIRATYKRQLMARSPGAEEAIARVAQAGHDVTVLVEVAVDRGGEDRHVGVHAVEGGEALRAREQADEADRARPGRPQAADGRDGGVAGGEHGIEHHHVALGHLVRHLEIVLHRLQRLRIAEEADVPHPVSYT